MMRGGVWGNRDRDVSAHDQGVGSLRRLDSGSDFGGAGVGVFTDATGPLRKIAFVPRPERREGMKETLNTIMSQKISNPPNFRLIFQRFSNIFDRRSIPLGALPDRTHSTINHPQSLSPQAADPQQ
jgi:hypothetical protein